MWKFLILAAFFAWARLASADNTYEISLGKDASVLTVEAALSGPRLSLRPQFSTYVDGLEIFQGKGWKPLPGHSWQVGPGQHRLRYRFRLRDSMREPGGVMSIRSHWFLVRGAGPNRLHFTSGGPARCVSVLPQDDSDSFVADEATLDRGPIFAFGPLAVRRHHIGQSTVVQAYVPGRLRLSDNQLGSWVGQSARAVADYFGRFPVERLLLVVVPGKELGGVTHGFGGASIILPIPPEMDPAEVLDSWQLTHELVHLAVPGQKERYSWLEEGIATYVEPLVRHRAGHLKGRRLWADLVEGVPRGRRAVARAGLDHNGSHAATYWGGALYCLLADVRLRQASHNRYSLQTALRAIVAEGGNVTQEWPLERVLKTADRATHSKIFSELHRQMGKQALHYDLLGLWRQLGIRPQPLSAGPAPLDYVRIGIATF